MLSLIKRPAKQWTLFVAALMLPALTGCQQKMADEGRVKVMEEESLFEDRASARPLVEKTIPRGYLKEDSSYFTGMENRTYAERFPMPVTRPLIERGRERFNIYCAVCHGRTGEGNGMVVQRGFTKPPSYFEQRLREAAPGYFFNVMSEGYGDMADYNDVLDEYDRWAVAAYIKTLQRSRNVALNEIPEPIKHKLEKNEDASAIPQ